MTKLKINGVEYPLEDGYAIKDKESEELDTGVIVVPFVDKLNLNPLDFVVLDSDKLGKIYMVVNTWQDDIASFDEMKYTYSISLISETIKLQKIVCPNLTITQPIGKTPKTIKQKLEEYYEVYIKPQYPEVTLSEEILELTEDMICPEREYSRPTMQEVIDGMLETINCVVRIENHQITYNDLSIYGKKIDESKIYYENETQDINDYANRLDIQVDNGVSKDVNSATPFGVSVRGAGYQLTDDNMVIPLQKPIYDMDYNAVYAILGIKKSNMSASDGYDHARGKVNITDHIVEKSVYDTYEATSDMGIITGKYYKRNALYFKSGGNSIEGLAYTDSVLTNNNNNPLTKTHSALYNVLTDAIQKTYGGEWEPEVGEALIKGNVLFYVEYKASDNFRLTLEKENKYNATLIDNQNEKEVEVNKFGKVEQDKLNRLGNKMKTIHAIYSYGDAIPQLTDYIGRYVLAEREIIYYDEYVVFKGYLYKDFIRKNYYYGLSSKKRFIQISNEPTIRNDVINYDMTFQFDVPENQEQYSYLTRFMLQPIVASSHYFDMAGNETLYNEYPKYCFAKTYDKDDNQLQTGYFLMSPSWYACGKTNVIQMKMEDNFNVGTRITTILGGLMSLQSLVPYVDNYGEFKKISIELRSSDIHDFLDTGNNSTSEIKTYYQIANNLPYVTETDIGSFKSKYILKDEKILYKDNRETTSISMNFNFKDTEDVIIGNITSFTGIGNNENSNSTLQVWYSTTEKYEVGDMYGLGQWADDVSISRAIYQDYIDNGTLFSRISIEGGSGFANWKSWGICDWDGNLLIGVNNPHDGNTIPQSIYLKVDKKDY